MTKLEELEAIRVAADAASRSAYYVAFDVVAADARDAAYEAAQLDLVVANDAYQVELKKAQQETPMTKLEELKAVATASAAASDAAWAVASATEAAATAAACAAETSYDAAYSADAAYDLAYAAYSAVWGRTND
tara:strand:- start:177 stop:578 length:402 start_codon:yes stop_codon:yes gene_type:complete